MFTIKHLNNADGHRYHKTIKTRFKYRLNKRVYHLVLSHFNIKKKNQTKQYEQTKNHIEGQEKKKKKPEIPYYVSRRENKVKYHWITAKVGVKREIKGLYR